MSRANGRAVLGLAGLLALGAGLVTAIVLLAGGKPGRPVAGTLPPARSHVPLPPRDAFVLAQKQGDLAVVLAVRPAGTRLRLIASVIGPDELGVNGLTVSFGTVAAHPCGSGCYSAVAPARGRSIVVRLGSDRVPFRLPAAWPPRPAGALVARAEKVFRSLRTLVLHEHLASGPGQVISAVFDFAAPDRMAYRIRGGPAGIVIGSSRWDRTSPTASWVHSSTDRQHQPVAPWTTVSNAYLLRENTDSAVVSFLDRRIPAWFTATIDRSTGRTLALQMTAAAHFMRHRYGPFNAPVSIRAPR